MFILAAVPRIFRFVPPAVVWPYLAVAAVTAVVLTVWFHRVAARRRRPTDRGSQAVVTAFLFFPMLALSIIWPITLPTILIVTRRRSGPGRTR